MLVSKSVFWGFFWGGGGYITRSEIAGSYVSSSFSFLRNIHTVFHSGCASSQSTNSIQGIPFLHIFSNSIHLCSNFFFNLLSLFLAIRGMVSKETFFLLDSFSFQIFIFSCGFEEDEEIIKVFSSYRYSVNYS